jgi:2',3'-cyclic-nucleotide 2'-phosphodiesterase (5'-nucleotidase family)
MKIKFYRSATILVVVAMLLSLFTSVAGAAPASPVTFTILHTNDFHGQLEAANADPNKISTPGMARTAKVINDIRTVKGAENVLLVDAGDEMQGSLLSNLGNGTATGKGAPTIAIYNAMHYDVATFGNHEFDWGQVNLGNRTAEATYPYVTANIVKLDGSDCASSGWTKPDFAAAPYTIKTVGIAPNQVNVAFIGVTTTETPTITVSTATAGLCFKDPATSILHYYDQMKADGADVIVVLSHLGFNDGGYGYGIPVYGDAGTTSDPSTGLAAKLIAAGKPADLIIGGHSHTSVSAPGTTVTIAGKTGSTLVVQSAYNGRRVGQADITVGTDGKVSISWKVTVWTQQNTTANPAIPASMWRVFTSSSAFTEITDVSKDPTVDSLIASYANDPSYLALVNTPVGYSAVDLGRSNTSDNMMGTFIDDAIYNYLNTDTEPSNDVDLFFNNAGGIRTDWCYVGGVWATAGCVAGAHAPALLTYGHMFTVLPFGNATVVGKMTGAQILEVINYAPNVAGVIQPAGLKYKYFSYKDGNPGPQPYAWGAFDVCVVNKGTGACDALDLKKTYSVGTNEFLAPAGGDGYNAFKYMKNITYWGDMLNAVNAYVGAHYGTPDTAYMGPDDDGILDGRIVRDGNDAGGSIVPITILHHNDSHGNLTKGAYVGYTQLVTLIKQEKLHNPDHTLLLSGGDNIQGDAMMYYFKSAGLGYAADGTVLPDNLKINPLIAAFNTMNYDAMDLGNHEFNFGSDIFKTLKQATFPILGANVSDSGAYGLAEVGVQPYIEKTLGSEAIKVAIMGITNHRVPNYELPSNIPGLTFSDPLAKAQQLSDLLNPDNDVVIALTHIGFTEDPKSVEVDKNVDTNMAKTVTGLDAIIGSHSHTNPATGFGDYKYLPSIVVDPDGKPVVIGQAYRYNNTLGEIILGLSPKAGGGYEVVSQTGRFLTVTTSTTEDAATKAIIDPYVTQLSAYNGKVLGQTTAPIDTRNAYVAETNGANLQADASIFELNSHGITPDFHLSGAMTRPSSPNDLMFPTATPDAPQTMTVANMFTLMPYENSLVVMEMNGPQLKAVLERAYRNYYYYKYVPGYGGYSYYTTCMIDTNFGNQIVYNDLYPALPNGNNVVSLVIGGKEIDFTDAAKYYRVSTVNYLAAGSCNFNDAGVSLWPLNQIVNDTQYYVRDAVIDYVTAKGIVTPALEGRLSFITDTAGPVISVNMPTATTYMHSDILALDFEALDTPAGVKTTSADLDGVKVVDGQMVDLYKLGLGSHTLTVNAVDKAGNTSTQLVTFQVNTSLDSLTTGVTRLYQEHKIDNKGVYNSLVSKLRLAAKTNNPEMTSALLKTFIFEVYAQRGHHIDKVYADALIADAQYVIVHLPDTKPPVITIFSPKAMTYSRPGFLFVSFAAYDTITGVAKTTATLDGTPVSNSQQIILSKLTKGNHTLTVTAVDEAGNTATRSVTFKVK